MTVWQQAIVTSFIGGAILWVLVWLLRNAMESKFLASGIAKILRVGPSIGGDWISTISENDNKYHEDINLKQFGTTIRGIIKLRQEGSDSREETIYKFKGTFKDRIVTADYTSIDPEAFERGVFALEYHHNKSMEGYYVQFKEHNKKGQFIPCKYEWIQKNK